MKKLFFNAVFVLMSFVAIAGGGKNASVVEGKILDDEGNPAVGAKVVLVETKEEVYTDFDGAFKFENVASASLQLKVSYVSHQELSMEISRQKISNNSLELHLESQ